MFPKNFKLNMDRLTIAKATDICDTNEFESTGFIMRNADGKTCLVEKGAVRWISKNDFWDIMHPAAVGAEIDAAIGLLNAAVCPCCDGGGTYYDNDCEPAQCQWCYEKNKLINDHKK